MSTLLESLNDNEFLFVAIPESEEAKNQGTRVFYGSLRAYNRQLKYFNCKGYGIFVTINRTLGSRRKEEDIVGYRAIFQDDDKGYFGGYPLEPGLVVNTSPGKYQRYWFIKGGENVRKDEWKDVQRLMVKYGNDPSVCDPPRVLRLPGFYHMKGGHEGRFMVTETGDGRAYPWAELRRAFEDGIPGAGLGGEAKKEKPAAADSGKSPLAVHSERVLSGENYNNALCSICMIQANAGLDKDSIRIFCEALMNAGKGPRDERWHDRFAHIGTYVNTAFEKIEEEGKEEGSEGLIAAKEGERATIDWPPGLMGELSKCAHRAMYSPNKTVAILTAFGLVAGICGRRYNISDTGLNIYITLLMNTGRGKDSVQQFISRTLMELNQEGNAFDYLGDDGYTGPKGVFRDLGKWHSRIAVFTEAGFMFKSKAGDQEGLLRLFLRLYTRSGQYGVLKGTGYSKIEDSLPTLYAPSLSIFNEATPATFNEELERRKSVDSGELARMSIFRIQEPKADFNEDNEYKLEENVRNRLRALVKDCKLSAEEKTIVPDVITFKRPDGFTAFSKYCISIETENEDTNPFYAVMHSRAPVKALKVAALISVFNDWKEVKEEAWDWALKLHEYEISGLEMFFKGSGKPDLDNALHNYVMPAIVKLMNGEIGELSQDFKKKRIFSYSNVWQIVRNNRSLLALSDANYTGLNRVLRHMLGIGLLTEVDASHLRVRGKKSIAYYKLTPEFNIAWKHDNHD